MPVDGGLRGTHDADSIRKSPRSVLSGLWPRARARRTPEAPALFGVLRHVALPRSRRGGDPRHIRGRPTPSNAQGDQLERGRGLVLAPAGADMSTAQTPRPRCPRCKGRRVVLVDHFDYLEFVPCPSCTHRDPPGRQAQRDHVETLARAA